MSIHWNRRKFTKEELVDAVKLSYSYAEVARRLGLNDSASAYNSVKPVIVELELDTSHFSGQGWNVGLGFKPNPARPIEEWLVKGSKISSSKLKAKILKAELLEPKCSAPFCPLPNPSVNPFTGEEVELKLALDHINGDNTDNRIENLRLLCYHCHGLTDTWCRGQKPKSPPKTYLCVECFEPIRRDLYLHKKCRRCILCGEFSDGRANYCRPCGGIPKDRRGRQGQKGVPTGRNKINWPSDEELLDRLSKSNYTRLGKELGVSDNAIRKRLARSQ